ncbi:MAG: Lrp/AsnC ligand binding domain-containing protein [Chloroflexi bacterium]|nr:Lrp/AsnC ligand binding domain-containing protein [Chloroflexota bacterium]
MKAFALISVPSGKSPEAVVALRKVPGVVEAWAVYGETDIVIKIDVPDHRTLDRLIMQDIQGMKLVQNTRTMIVIESV